MPNLNAIYRVLANTVYLVPLQVRKFQTQHPRTPILAAGATKAIQTAEDQDVQRGPQWATARRRALIATPDGLICGDWRIPTSAIKQATLLRVRFLFADALVLKIATDEGKHYQFGLQYDPAWENNLPFPVSVEVGKIKRLLFSVAVWVVIGAILVYRIIQQLRSK